MALFEERQKAVLDRTQPIVGEGGVLQGVILQNPGLAILALEAHGLGTDVLTAANATSSQLQLVGEAPNQGVLIPASEVDTVIRGLEKVVSPEALHDHIADRHKPQFGGATPKLVQYAQPLGSVLSNIATMKY